MLHPRSALESGLSPAPIPIAIVFPFVIDGAANIEKNLDSPTASPWSLSPFKRLIDLMGAVLVLILMGIPMLAIALCVRLSSRGPAIFAQNRVGREGRHFRMYKFRSMALDA